MPSLGSFQDSAFKVTPQKEVDKYLLGKQKQPSGEGIPFEPAIWCRHPCGRCCRLSEPVVQPDFTRTALEFLNASYPKGYKFQAQQARGESLPGKWVI